MKERLYPVGKQDFPKIIKGGFVYVDKTKFILDLMKIGGSFFLSKPRRFGKSLFISTLESAFLGRKELFKGLAIWDKWKFEEYPIIRISFSDIGYRELGLERAIENKLLEIAQSYDVTLVGENTSFKFKELIQKLCSKFGKEVVILIDEYDKPLIDYLDKESLHQAIQNRSILKTFYSILKDAEPFVKLLFITGVTRFSKVSIFSDLNNLTDISMNLMFNEICGISQKELEDNFPDELLIYDKSKIKEWYNGYKWDSDGATLYNPFSLLHLFYNQGKFKNFWYASGTPTFLMKLCREQHLFNFEEITINQDDLSNFDIENLKIIPILFQTGYLTIKNEDVLNSYILSFPNNEVRESYLRNLADAYINSPVISSTNVLQDILKALQHKDKKVLLSSINLAFQQVPYGLWQKENEQYYHALVHLLFSLLGVYVFSEVQTKNGRTDTLVLYENQVYCFEFKLDQSANEAIEQIKKKGYTERFSGKTIHHIGVNFSSKDKAVEEIVWEEV